MKILITGSTGLVGTALVRQLAHDGHTVLRLVRPGSTSAPNVPGAFDVAWNPETGALDGAAVGADAVVNLAGASIADGRWTPQRKQLLRASRVQTTDNLVHALARMAARPRVLVSASAIGYYGNRGDEVLTEDSPAGTDFLSDLAREWEGSARKAEALGIRVVLTRFGIILDSHGGALPKMLPPFRIGLGGRLGSGQQWMSWITLKDTVAALLLALQDGTVRGPVNFVAPHPVRNSEFTADLAQALHRPAILPAPKFALRLALGEMADALLFSSQRVTPDRLQKLGFTFAHPDLLASLRFLLSDSART